MQKGGGESCWKQLCTQFKDGKTLSVNDIWEFSFDAISHFLFLNATFTQISFYCRIFFYGIIFFPCVRLCYFVKACVTLTCLVMQMSSMQIHYRLFFFLLKGNCHFYISLCLSSSRGYYYCVSFCFFFLYNYCFFLKDHFCFILFYYFIPVYFRP